MAEVGDKRERDEGAGNFDQGPKSQAYIPEPDPDLPPDWEQHVSRRSGKPYWYNVTTKQTTWVHPAKQSEGPPGSPPDHQDELHGPRDPPGFRVQMHPLTKMPMRPDGVPCKHWCTFGNCKFESRCKNDHPASFAPESMLQQFQIRAPGTPVPSGFALVGGLPVRPGIGACEFFMKTGMCKFGESCKFHHPQERQTKLACMVSMNMKANTMAPPAMAQAQQPMRMMMQPQISTPAFAAGNMSASMSNGVSGGMSASMAGGMAAGMSSAMAAGMSSTMPGGMNGGMAGGMMGVGGQMVSPHPPPPQPPQPPADHGWETHMSDQGRHYYYNNLTGVSTWETPAELLVAAAPQVAQPAVPQMMSAGMGGGFSASQPQITNYMQPAGGYGGQAAGFGGQAAGGFQAPPSTGFQAQPAGGQQMQNTDLPYRPEAQECSFYMKNGTCRFGANCKYNHPPRPAGAPVLPQSGGGGGMRGPPADSVAKAGQLPIRPGERDCPFYMKTATCRYGDTCKYNHPPAVGMGM